MALHLSAELARAVIDHAYAELPNEACGLLAAPVGNDQPTRQIAMANADLCPTRYQFDPAEQLTAYRRMDDEHEWPAVIYHSHPNAEAYPSTVDIKYASEPEAHYLIVSLRDEPNLRSFRISSGAVTEEPVLVDGTEHRPPCPTGPATPLANGRNRQHIAHGPLDVRGLDEETS